MQPSNISYDLLSHYLVALTSDPKLATVSIPMAAEFLGMTTQGVIQRVKRGRLSAVKVGGTRLILASELFEIYENNKNETRRIKDYLVKRIQSTKEIMTYRPVMEHFGYNYKLQADRLRFGDLLGWISEETEESHGVLLSVVVVRQDTNLPSEDGFIGLLNKLRPGWNREHDLDEYVAKEIARVWKVLFF